MAEIKVELVDSMGDDLRVANVARVSFDKWKEEFDQKDASLINYLAAHEHTSPFRHTAISVRCYAPVFLARQLGKHQVGLSWNEVSRRYVDVDVEFFVPPSWRSRPDNGIKQGSGSEEIENLYYKDEEGYVVAAEPVKEAYEGFIKDVSGFYEQLLKNGVAPEMARMILPQSMMVSWVWTGSLQAFYHVYRLRNGEGAQEEAKVFAKLLEEVVEPIFPHSWKALKNEPD